MIPHILYRQMCTPHIYYLVLLPLFTNERSRDKNMFFFQSVLPPLTPNLVDKNNRYSRNSPRLRLVPPPAHRLQYDT